MVPITDSFNTPRGICKWVSGLGQLPHRAWGWGAPWASLCPGRRPKIFARVFAILGGCLGGCRVGGLTPRTGVGGWVNGNWYHFSLFLTFFAFFFLPQSRPIYCCLSVQYVFLQGSISPRPKPFSSLWCPQRPPPHPPRPPPPRVPIRPPTCMTCADR